MQLVAKHDMDTRIAEILSGYSSSLYEIVIADEIMTDSERNSYYMTEIHVNICKYGPLGQKTYKNLKALIEDAHILNLKLI